MPVDQLLEQLRAEYRSMTDRASRLVDTSKAEGRDLSEHEAGEVEDAVRELRTLSERIAVLEARQAREREVDGARQHAEQFLRPGGAGEFTDPYDTGVREFFRGESRAMDVTFAGLRVERNAHGRAEVRSLLTSNSPIPISFRNQLYQHLVFNSAIRQVATTISASSGERLILPKTTAHPASGTIVAEGALIGESDPSFGQGTLNAYKYGNLIQISSETEQDVNIDLSGYIATAMGRSLGLGSGAHFVTGTGVGQPQGVLVGAGTIAQVTGGTPAASGATYAELVALFDKVIPAYQAVGTWFMSQGALSKLRALVNSQGSPLFQESLQAATGASLFGKPVTIDPAMPAVGVGGTSLAFGDFGAYVVRDLGVRFERSLDYAFGTDLVTYRAVLRADGLLLDLTGAIATYKGGAS